MGDEGNFQGELCVDHAVAVGVFRECAHGKLFSQQLAAADFRGQRTQRETERHCDQSLSQRRDDWWAACQSGAWPIWLHGHCLAFSVRNAGDCCHWISGTLLYGDGIGCGASGFCTLGAQFGNNAASGLLYPTASRSSGVGWALGIGRFGSIAGPLVGGLLVGMKVPARQLFVLAAMPMVAGLIASICVLRLCYQRLGGVHLDEMAQTVSPKTTAKLLDDPF